MMIYITIPVFNRKDYLRGCLESLKQQTNQNFKIIVTDDGSTDGTDQMLASEFPEVILLKGDGSLWWTGATNLAVEKALEMSREEDWILVLNDDLTVPKDYIQNYFNLVEKHQGEKVLLGSVVTDIVEHDKIYSGGVQINWWLAKIRDTHIGKSIKDFPPGYEQEASYLTGRGVLIPTKAFRELGLYNNNHFQQCGDTEFPVRAKKAGYKLLVCYNVPVYSYNKDEGHINHLHNFKLKTLKKYYFDTRSNMNLKYRFWFAMDCTRNPLHGLWYFALDFIRITGHFFRRVKYS